MAVTQGKCAYVFPLILSIAWIAACPSFAPADSMTGEQYVFTPDGSFVEGSVGYAVLGVYRARFNDFSGVVYFDRSSNRPASVDLKIKAGSIQSKYPFYDSVVRSPKILDVEQYPLIGFRSTIIEQKNGDYFVKGILSMHGISKEISSPFCIAKKQQESGQEILEASGTWVIRRKDFGVVWNKWLDHGGIIVGDHVTIDWKIKALSTNEGFQGF